MAEVHLIDLDVGVGCLLGAAGYEVRMYAAPGDYLMPVPDPEPGCLVLDLQLPGLSGSEFLAALRRHSAYRHPVIFLAAEVDVPASVRAMRAGAHDVLIKPVDGLQLLAAVEEAIEHDKREREARSMAQLVRERIESLSGRQRKVLKAIAAGTLSKRIAADLDVSGSTVKHDRAQIMKRLHACSIADLFQQLFAAGDIDRLLQ